MNVKSQKTLLFLFLVLSVIFNLFFFGSVSILTDDEGGDSCIFKQMGLALVQGKELYKDLFDHKGPIIFYINALAIYLNNGRWGLFLLHVLNYVGVFYLWYKICDLFECKFWSVLGVIISGMMIYLTLFGTKGNKIEDWIMIPLSYSLYVGLKEALGKNTNIFDYLMIGAFSGVIIFMRANSGVILFCTFVLLIYQAYTHRDFDKIKRIICYVILGFLFVTLSIFMHFYIRWGLQGIDNLIFGTFLFNFSIFKNLPNTVNGWYTYILHFGFFAILSVFCVYKRLIRLNVFVYLLSCIALTYVLVGRAKFDYYLIIIIPIYIPLFATLFNNFKLYFLPVLFLFLLAKQKILWGNLTETVMQREHFRREFKSVDEIINKIPLEERTSIWNYNANVNGLKFLQRNRITQCNLVLWNFHIKYSERLRNANEGKMQEKPPRWILLQKSEKYINESDSLFIVNNYQLKDSLSFQNMTFYFCKKK